MAPKSSGKKPSATASWYHCEHCSIHIPGNARDTHDKLCPVAENSTELDFIQNGTLHSSSLEQRTFHIEELKHMPHKYLNNLLFISAGVMSLCNWHIGQYVTIVSMQQPDRAALVRSLWPVPEKFLTTVFVSEDDFKQYWQPVKADALLIKALGTEFPTAAGSVLLQIENAPQDVENFEEQQYKQLEVIAKGIMKQLLFVEHNLVHVNFYNLELQLRVLSWVGKKTAMAAEQNEELALADALQLLNLSKQQQAFQVTAATRIEVLRSAQENVKEEPALISKADIGGLDEQLHEVEFAMNFALGFIKGPKAIKPARALLLHGPNGCGKTLICEVMRNMVQQKAPKALILQITASEMFSKYMGETERNLQTHLDKAFTHYPEPTLIIVEDLPSICPREEKSSMIARVSSAFYEMLDQLSHKKEARRVFIICTAVHLEDVSQRMLRVGRIGKHVELSAPSPAQRLQILQALLRTVSHNITASELKDLADITHGFVGADLDNLIRTATMQLYQRTGCEVLDGAELKAALSAVKPSAMREVAIENPNVHWSDIGGNAELKLKLQQAIEWPLKHAAKFKQLGIKAPRGVLMFGPPGCSKTMVAKALATESNLNFLSVKGPELFSMWVGESERAVREVFRKARQVAPAIVFFDEIDAISSERSDSGAGSSVKERVLTQLLTELDGVNSLENVTVVAATNRPDMIDKALLRPGRFDRIIYVGLPDADSRREIFRIKLSQMPVAADIDMEQLVLRTENYSGAEITAICQEAAFKVLEEDMNAQLVQWQHFELALQQVQARTSTELLQLYETYLSGSLNAVKNNISND